MAPAEGRVAKRERQWGFRRGTHMHRELKKTEKKDIHKIITTSPLVYTNMG